MKTACPLLWNHFCIKSYTRSTPCCRVDMRDNILDWMGWDIDKGIFSSDHKNTRNLMRRGIRPDVCKVCYKKEDIGLKSDRQKYLDIYKNINYMDEPVNVETADIKFNNTCNLACRMCSPSSSSLIASLLKDIPLKDRIHNTPIRKNLYKEEEKLEICKNLIRQGLKEFKTTGGEPFYQKHFHKLIDWCIDNGFNKNLKINITTNGTVDDNILKKLNTFKHCHLNISIDGYKSVYEYIRYPGKWSDIDNALKKIIDLQSEVFSVSISTVLSIYNIFDLPNIEKYLLDIGYKEKLLIDTYIKPYETSELNVKNLPQDVIQKAIKANSAKVVNDYLKSLKHIDMNRELLSEFVRKTKLYDKHRKQSYTILHPQIVELFKDT